MECKDIEIEEVVRREEKELIINKIEKWRREVVKDEEEEMDIGGGEIIVENKKF